MQDTPLNLLEVIKEMDLHRGTIIRLIDAGKSMTDPDVVKVSQMLDRCVNLLYRGPDGGR